MTNAARAQRIWENAGLLTGPIVEAYFHSRGLIIPKTGKLRFAPSLPHDSGASYPAIVARVDRVNGDMVAIQRTFLALDGSGKAPVDTRKQKMSLGPTKGGAIRLAERVDGVPLMLGEGVETVQTVIQATGYPGWATLGTSGFKPDALPDEVKDVILLGENDGGMNARAIAKVATDLKKRGVRVRVAHPPEGFKDFNDMVMGAADLGAAFEAVRKAVEGAEDWVDSPDSEDEGRGKKPTQAAIIARLAMTHCDAFFHDENSEAYAILHAEHNCGVHREVHRLKSKSFKEWLLLVYFNRTNGVPNDNSVRSAIGLLGAIARHRGEQREVFVRRAFYEGNKESRFFKSRCALALTMTLSSS
jgi:hypothetical protein